MMTIKDVMFWVLWDKSINYPVMINGGVATFETADEAGEAWRGLTEEEGDRFDIMAVTNSRYEIYDSEHNNVFDKFCLVYGEHFYHCDKCMRLMLQDDIIWCNEVGLCFDCYDDYAETEECWEDEINAGYPHIMEFLEA